VDWFNALGKKMILARLDTLRLKSYNSWMTIVVIVRAVCEYELHRSLLRFVLENTTASGIYSAKLTAFPIRAEVQSSRRGHSSPVPKPQPSP
jgi:hypothetical protein